jgi:hypothetical protein
MPRRRKTAHGAYDGQGYRGAGLGATLGAAAAGVPGALVGGTVGLVADPVTELVRGAVSPITYGLSYAISKSELPSDTTVIKCPFCEVPRELRERQVSKSVKLIYFSVCGHPVGCTPVA